MDGCTLYICICLIIYRYVSQYIHICREREREREPKTKGMAFHPPCFLLVVFELGKTEVLSFSGVNSFSGGGGGCDGVEEYTGKHLVQEANQE